MKVALCLLIALASLPAVAEAPWNVEDTGQPSIAADFTVTEGTWMSVDVSPDGGTLAFDLLGDIYTMPANGGDAVAVLSGAAMQRDPRFSPDGRALLYISDADGADNVWLANRDGSGARQLTRESTRPLTGPAWGPDGSYFAAARLFDDSASLHASELRLYDLRGGDGQLLVGRPAVGENVHEAQFAPDGQYLYYTEKTSPPTRSVVYIDANHVNYAVMRRDLRDGRTELLAQGYGSATTPRPSPDGRRIAFVRRVQSRTILFTLDLATRQQLPVFEGLDRDAQADFIGQGSYYPQYGWFPDSRHVAIWGRGRLWKVDMDTGKATEIPFRARSRHRITAPPRFTAELAPERFTVRAIRQLAYSPDGATVVFNALGRLWSKRLPDGVPSRLTSSRAFEFEPAWSPDGRQIAYVEWDDERGAAIRVVPASGGPGRVLVPSGGVLRQPSWSPDGRRIVYRIDGGDGCLGGHGAQTGIYWMDVSGGESRRVAESADAPVFSPDGSRIYFSVAEYVDPASISSLVSVDLAGGDRRIHLRTRDADTSELRPSPDLRWIAFRDRQQYYVARYRETGQPIVLDAGGQSLPVARLGETGGYGLAWSADSRRVHWVVGERLDTLAVAGLLESGTRAAPTSTRVGLSLPSDRPSGLIALTNGRIITMRGEEVIENGTVVIEGNRITAVGEAGTLSIPGGARVIDIAGKTVMPGLVDMHGHIDECYYTSSGLMPQKQAARFAALAFGVTLNYDPYTSELPSFSQAEMTLSGDMTGPRAIDSGLVAYGRSGKGDRVFIPIASYRDALAFMQRKRELGAVIVKSYRQPMRSQRQMLIKAGREAGIMVDVEGESNFYNNLTMILDGNTNLQHNFPVATYYDDVVQLMRAAKSSHTPTLIVLFGELMGENWIYQRDRAWENPKVRTFVQSTTSGYSPLAPGHYAPPWVRGMTTVLAADEIYEIGVRSVARSMRKLDDAGVTVSVGSHGQVAGLAQHWEMWLLAEGGMANHRVLRAATLSGAQTLGLDGQIGSLEAGKLADLVVMDGNPLEDIRDTNTVRYTMVNGRLFDAYTLNEIGNYDRPRGKFYWEVGRPGNASVEWNKAWAHP